MREYLAALDEVEPVGAPPKYLSMTDPAARWTAAPGCPAFYAYSTNYLVDIESGVIVDVEATAAHRIEETDATKTMIERVEARHHIKPQRLIGDTAYGTGPMLEWMVEDKGIEPHVPVWEPHSRSGERQLIIQSPPPMSEFLYIANGVSADVVATNGPGLRIAREVDDLFRTRLFGTDLDVGISSANMAMASYFSFLGGIRATLSGHVAAVFPLIRHGLECACYAYRFEEDEALAEAWLHRHRGEAEQRACRRAFRSAVADVSASVTAQQEDLGRLVSDLYQASMDFGAHPNPRSILNNLSIDENREDGLVGVSLACLCGPQDLRVQSGLVACAETGIASAFVIALAAEDHPLLADQYRALGDIYAQVQETVVEIQRAAQ